MIKKKTIYKGFNKRKKRTKLKVMLTLVGVFVIGGYSYKLIKVKDFNVNLFDKFAGAIPTLNLDFTLDKLMPKKSEVTEYTYDDIKDKVQDTKKEESEDVKIAKVDSWSIYSVQVASISKEEELKKIESNLNENKIPFSVIQIDGVKKVQTYGSFNKDSVRQHLESMRKLYPDAFLSESNIPMLSLEYTSKYSYVESISVQLNNLIKNYEEESKVWQSNDEDIDLAIYKNILTSRKEIISQIKKENEKIDYKEMSAFKESLDKYVSEVDDKIELSSKSANEGKYQLSQGLFLSCMQEYLEFINSMKQL